MEKELVDILSENKLHIATVESCTGGMIASNIVNVSGASSVFEYGFVTYSNNAKANVVYVDEALLAKYGAVSRECAIAMAEGAKKVSGADICISVTGVAGPGTDEGKKVGLVYIGIAAKTSKAYELHLSGDRMAIRNNAARYAIELSIKTIKEEF